MGSGTERRGRTFRLRLQILLFTSLLMVGGISTGLLLTIRDLRGVALRDYRQEGLALVAPLESVAGEAQLMDVARWQQEFASLKLHGTGVLRVNLYARVGGAYRVLVSTATRFTGRTATADDLLPLSNGRPESWNTSVGGRPALEVDVPVLMAGRPAAVLGIYISTVPLQAEMAAAQDRWSVLGAGGVLVTLVLLFLFLDRRVLRRLERLVRVARELEAGNLTARLPRSGRDELGELEEGFNRAADSLAESVAIREERRVAFRDSLTSLGEAMRLGMEEVEVLRRILLSSLQVVQAVAGSFFLRDEVMDGLRLAVAEGGERLPPEVAISKVVGTVYDLEGPAESRFLVDGVPWSVQAVPLARAGKLLAIVVVAAPRETGFDQEDVLNLGILADQAAMALENLRLYREREADANTDRLTGVANYRFLRNFLQSRWGGSEELSLLMVDLDNFKAVNDTFGHLTGDQVLQRMATTIQEKLRSQDVVCRYGGDEFVVVLPETDPGVAVGVAERVRAALAGIDWDEMLAPGCRITASVGVATAQPAGMMVDELLAAADEALYRAKAKGRNAVAEAASSQGREERLRQKVQMADLQSIRLLAKVADIRDRYSGEHGEEALRLARGLTERLQLSPLDQEVVEVGCLLHDIGKVGVDDEALNKAGPLTPQERADMEQHPVLGAQLLGQVMFMKASMDAVLYHHERWDGKGYPEGLKGESIPLAARIVAVLDAYQAMTSDRPYRQRLSRAAAREELQQGAGTQFDPRVVDLFLATLDDEEEEAQTLTTAAREVATGADRSPGSLKPEPA